MAEKERKNKVSDLKVGTCNLGSCEKEYKNIKRRLAMADDPEDDDRPLEAAYVDMFKCLRATGGDHDITAIQLDSLFAFGDIISEQTRYKNARKEELMDEHLIAYCTGIYSLVYQTFVIKMLGNGPTPNEAVRKPYRAAMELFSKIVQIIRPMDEDDAQKLFDILLLKQYLHTFYLYATDNHSMTDLLTNGTLWEAKNKELVKRERRKKSDRVALSEIYDKEYEIGCNCFCGTITFGVFLRLLAKNKRINMNPEDVVFYNDYSNATTGHIALGVKFKGDRQLYLETTCSLMPDLNLLDTTQAEKKLSYVENILHASDEYIARVHADSVIAPIPTDDIPLIILHQRFARRDCVSVWHARAPDVLENDLFDTVVAKDSTVAPALRVGKLYHIMSKFTNSIIMWNMTVSILRRLIMQLDSMDPALTSQKYNGHTYQQYFEALFALPVKDAKAKSAQDAVRALVPWL